MILTATAEKVEAMASRAVAKFACVRINLRQFTIVDRLSAKFRRAIPRLKSLPPAPFEAVPLKTFRWCKFGKIFRRFGSVLDGERRYTRNLTRRDCGARLELLDCEVRGRRN